MVLKISPNYITSQFGYILIRGFGEVVLIYFQHNIIKYKTKEIIFNILYPKIKRKKY